MLIGLFLFITVILFQLYIINKHCSKIIKICDLSFLWFSKQAQYSKTGVILHTRLRCITKQKKSYLSETEQIINVIEKFFEIGKTKNLAALREIQLDDPNFSSFSDFPPFELQDYSNTLILEELRFVSISDYDYEITNPKISIFGNCAVVAIGLMQKGMLIDNKAYTGEHMVIHGRGTFVLIKKPIWKIIHMHLSKIDE